MRWWHDLTAVRDSTSVQVFPQLMVKLSVHYNVSSIVFNRKQTFGRNLCRDICADERHFFRCGKGTLNKRSLSVGKGKGASNGDLALRPMCGVSFVVWTDLLRRPAG